MRLRAEAANETKISAGSGEIQWRKFLEKAQPGIDAGGRTILRAPDGNRVIELGVARGNLQTEGAPVELQRELLLSRLKQAVAASRARRISGSELREDWKLLEKIDGAEPEIFTGEFGSENPQTSQKTAPH